MTEKDLTQEKKQILEDFLQRPSIYHVEVKDNVMLPEKLKDRKVIDFVVKPPTLTVLAATGLLLMELPKDLLDPEKTVPIAEALKHADTMVKVFCRISWGNDTEYPKWYEPFIKSNTTPMEIYKLFVDVYEKGQTGFFLNSMKLASLSNPMMLLSLNEITRFASQGKSAIISDSPTKK